MSKILETLSVRKDILNKTMKDFEKNRDPAYIIGFYSSLIKELAVARPDTFLETERVLKTYTIAKE